MMLWRVMAGARSRLGVVGTTQVRELNDVSRVPDVMGQRKRRKRVDDFGYHANYNLGSIDGSGGLPRLEGEKVPVAGMSAERVDEWGEAAARFGQNDYIDILGDGSVHPAHLLYHVPGWLRGFPGDHKANELVRLIHYRNMFKQRLERYSPRRYHNLQKRILHLMKYHNYYKQDEIRAERSLGLWNEAPDYFYKDKTRRSFMMTPYSAT